MPDRDTKQKRSLHTKIFEKFKNWYAFYFEDIWKTDRSNWRIDIAKTVNLSVSTIMDKDIQSTAYAMSFRTLLATVPALALLFAIGRGFGFSNIMRASLLNYFPAQKVAIEKALGFVDSYLSQASEGIFVGIGLIFLLWTLISLLSSAETAFNKIWGVSRGRTLWRQISDYTAICLILPVFMICSTGINIFMSGEVQKLLPMEFLTPVISTIIDSAGILLIWAFFTGLYKLVPNTHVKFKHAAVSGIIAGTAFVILQFLFVSGQIYVSKYNAIYGSFAFLPLLMIWLQFVWLITLAGAVVCYSAQNIFRFSYSKQISSISLDYQRKILLAVTTVITNNFKRGLHAPTMLHIAQKFEIPVALVNRILDELIQSGIIIRTAPDGPKEEVGYVPAIPIERLTVGLVLKKIRQCGSSDFIEGFNKHFRHIDKMFDELNSIYYKTAENYKIIDLEINNFTSKNNTSKK